MNAKTDIALLPPFAAGLAGWMLSGSAVPMALAAVVLVLGILLAPLAEKLRHLPPTRWLLPSGLAMLATWVQMRLFQDGRALATGAELPLFFHLAFGLILGASLDACLRAAGPGSLHASPRLATGALGGLLLLAVSGEVPLYEFGPWEVHCLAALPFALWACQALLPDWSLPRRLALAVVPTGILLAGILALAQAGTESLRSFWNDDRSEDPESLAAPAPNRPGRGPLGEGSSRRLPRESDIRFRGEVVVRLHTDSAELFRVWTSAPLYLRTSSLALFDSEEVLSPLRSGNWIHDADDGIEDRAITLDGVVREVFQPDPRTLHSLYVDRSSVQHLPLFEGSTALFLPAVYQFADDWFQISPADDILRLRYTAAMPLRAPLEARPVDLEGRRSEPPPGVYLQLPPSPLSARIADLAASLDRDRPLAAIRERLAGTRYSLRFSTPEGSSPLAEFLFGHGMGHCEHYAASTVLLLRSLGIPSRISYGYAGGIADPAQRLVAFRDSDFHAWAEVLTPANEWRIFDTTPRVEGSAPRSTAQSSLPRIAPEHFLDLSDFNPAAKRKTSFRTDFVEKSIALLSRHFLSATAVGLLVLGLLWRLLPGRGRPLRRLPREENPEETPVPIPHFLVRWERGAPSGLHRRAGQTWKEYLAALSERGPVPAAARDAVDYHYHILYQGGARDRELEEHFSQELRPPASGEGT